MEILKRNSVIVLSSSNISDAKNNLPKSSIDKVLGFAVEFAVKDLMRNNNISFEEFDRYAPVDFAIGNTWYDVKYSHQKNTHTISRRELKAWEERINLGFEVIIISTVYSSEGAIFKREYKYSDIRNNLHHSFYMDGVYFYI